MLGILEHPNIDPVIFTLISNAAGEPVIALRWYGLMYVLAFVFGYFVFRWLQKTGYLRIKTEDVTNIIVTGVLGTFLGGRLGYLFFYQFDRLFLGDGGLTVGERIAMVFKVWEGGMSFHGGVFGVGLAVLIYARVKKHGFWNIIDGAVHIVPLGVALVRIGNFINGELYGRAITDDSGNPITAPDKLPWYAMKFPTDHHTPGAQLELQRAMQERYAADNPGATTIPDSALQVPPVDPGAWEQASHFFPGRYPSQLVQFAFEGVLVFIAIWLLRRKLKRPGLLGAVFLMLYAVFRIPAELIRQPDSQVDPARAAELGGTAAFLSSIGMTMGQFLSVVIFVTGLALFLLLWFKPLTGRDYTKDERRCGFLKDTIRNFPYIIGLKKEKPEDGQDNSDKNADKN